ncbi:MAG: hypothetical protein IPG64_23320 [Haliea sp.]|nr:hypothetical protein [Haliea sp.]
MLLTAASASAGTRRRSRDCCSNSPRRVVYIAGETVYDPPVTQQIHAENAYTPAWTNPVALQELSAAIGRGRARGHESRRLHHQPAVQGLPDWSPTLDNASRDLLLTDSLLRPTYHYAFGKVDPKTYTLRPGISTARCRRPGAMDLGMISNGGITAAPERLAHRPHVRTFGALTQYRAIDAEGGWGRLIRAPRCGSAIPDPGLQMRQRLHAEGDLAEDNYPNPRAV